MSKLAIEKSNKTGDAKGENKEKVEEEAENKWLEPVIQGKVNL